ncbi:hypothetical protein [Trichormus sp. NMC-1]|nr:hypothetical protein [Trichormus sp. NMC-1]
MTEQILSTCVLIFVHEVDSKTTIVIWRSLKFCIEINYKLAIFRISNN